MTSTDPLSATGHSLSTTQNPRFNDLVLGSLTEDESIPEELSSVTLPSLFAQPIRSPEYAYLSLAAIYLFWGALDWSHRIAQLEPHDLHIAAVQKLRDASPPLSQFSETKFAQTDEETLGSTSAFWHAVIHRREGDFSNSKYWYRRCTDHPVLATLAVRVEDLTRNEPADKSLLKITANGFNPNAFVDLVEAVHGKPNDPRFRLAVVIQHTEWQTLFDYCTRMAVR